jgi:hypothetical protein
VPNSRSPTNHFAIVQRQMAKLGCEGVYLRKTSSSCRAAIGNAIFWRTDRFSLRSKKEISKAYFRGQQVALVAELKTVSGARVAVCTTHIVCAFAQPPRQVAQVQRKRWCWTLRSRSSFAGISTPRQTLLSTIS